MWLCSSVEPGCDFLGKCEEITIFCDALVTKIIPRQLGLDSSRLPSWLQPFLALQWSLHEANMMRPVDPWFVTILPVGVMSKLPEVCLRIFISSVCLLSHSVLNSYWTHDILCTLLQNVFFFTFVPLCMVFSLPGSHYPSLFSTNHVFFSSKIEYRHHSSRNLPWHSLFSSFQVRLAACILYSWKHSQLPLS